MSIFEQFEMNGAAEVGGVWLAAFKKNSDGTTPGFLISRQADSNKEWVKAVERLTKPFSYDGSALDIDNDTAIEINCKIFAASLIKDWRNIVDKDGNLIPFNVDNAVELLSSLPELFRKLNAFSLDVAKFRESSLRDDAKN